MEEASYFCVTFFLKLPNSQPTFSNNTKFFLNNMALIQFYSFPQVLEKCWVLISIFTVCKVKCKILLF